MRGGAACDHRSRAAPESCQGNHHDVNKQEENQGHGDKEVNRASGLTAAQEVDGPGEGGSKAEGQRQAAPDDEGEKNKDYKQVREALEPVVGRSLRRAWPLKAQRFCTRGQERPP